MTIDGIDFIRVNYPLFSNSNNVETYKRMYHPDALWCPPDFDDKRGQEQIAFAYGLKGYFIKVKVLEIEGLNGTDHAYVTGLVSVAIYSQKWLLTEEILLRGSWVIVLYEGRPVIRYQVWNKKNDLKGERHWS